MLRRTLPLLALLVAATTGAISAGTGPALANGSGGEYGPQYHYTTELMGGRTIPLKNAALITRTKHGLLYRAGQQNSRLRVTKSERHIRFVDRGTRKLKKLPRGCHRTRAGRGIGAVCRIIRPVSERRPLLVEVWPRLGNDHVDGSSLPASVDMTVLGDKGADVVRFGAGDDFFNGHLGRDRVWGGGGRDWLRTGDDSDIAWGGAGKDRIVAMQGNDRLIGGRGVDKLEGGPGHDHIRR